MLKYSFIFILLTALLLSCEREISPEQADSFIKFYGNYLVDQAGDVEVLADGGYAICGTESSPTFGKRMILIVTDSYGNVRSGFPKYFVEEGLETGGTSLIALENGSDGFFITGFVERPVAGSEEVQKDVFLVRASATGDEIWQRSYGSADDELVDHSVKRISSGYLLAGHKIHEGKSDILIMGLTEEGDSIRLGLNYSNPYAENSAASFLLNTGEFYLCVCTYDKKNSAGTGIQILSFDDELSPIAKNISGDFNEYGMCIIEEGPEEFLVLGNRENGTGHSELVLYGIETNGLLITNSSLLASISAPGTDYKGQRLVETASGKLAIAGTRQIGNNSEILLQFFSSSYQAEEGVSYGSSGTQTGRDIELTKDGGFVLLGTNNYGGGSNISLLKTSATGDI
ncbi:MAG: hypothetical protein P1P86_08155 [Bacteroidales bacterium]|nr:hypothetical protein [Bacteroidales bacterium]